MSTNPRSFLNSSVPDKESKQYNERCYYLCRDTVPWFQFPTKLPKARPINHSDWPHVFAYERCERRCWFFGEFRTPGRAHLGAHFRDVASSWSLWNGRLTVACITCILFYREVLLTKNQRTSKRGFTLSLAESGSEVSASAIITSTSNACYFSSVFFFYCTRFSWISLPGTAAVWWKNRTVVSRAQQRWYSTGAKSHTRTRAEDFFFFYIYIYIFKYDKIVVFIICVSFVKQC